MNILNVSISSTEDQQKMPFFWLHLFADVICEWSLKSILQVQLKEYHIDPKNFQLSKPKFNGQFFDDLRVFVEVASLKSDQNKNNFTLFSDLYKTSKSTIGRQILVKMNTSRICLAVMPCLSIGAKLFFDRSNCFGWVQVVLVGSHSFWSGSN